MPTTPFQFGYALGCETAASPAALNKNAGLDRVLASALVATAGGLALGAYPGLKAQEASENAGYSKLTSFAAGKAPIFLASALSAGLYNEWRDHVEQKNKQKAEQDAALLKPPPGPLHYLRYLAQ